MHTYIFICSIATRTGPSKSERAMTSTMRLAPKRRLPIVLVGWSRPVWRMVKACAFLMPMSRAQVDPRTSEQQVISINQMMFEQMKNHHYTSRKQTILRNELKRTNSDDASFEEMSYFCGEN